MTLRKLTYIVAFVIVSSLMLTTTLVAAASAQAGVTNVQSKIKPTGDYPPEIYPQPTVEGAAGVELAIWVLVADLDNDPLHVEFDFGDGSPNGTNDTGPAGNYDQELIQFHAWNPPHIPGLGDYTVNYTLNITATDPDGRSKTVSVPVMIHVGWNLSPYLHVLGPVGSVDPTDNVSIEVYASDPEGEPITWTYVFNDSFTDVYAEVRYTDWTAPNATVYNNISYIFGEEGNYTLTVYVSDALPPNQIFPHNISMTSGTIRVLNNSPPMYTEIVSDPSQPVIPGVMGYIDVTLLIEVFDRDGDVVTVLWSFGDGSPQEVNTTDGVGVFLLTQVHRFYDQGWYNITANITDGRAGHERMEYLMLYVASTNLPPSIIQFDIGKHGPIAFAGENLGFVVLFNDAEEDTIEVTWDFGDGSPFEFQNLTGFRDQNVTGYQTHAYALPGTYLLKLTYTDNKSGLFNHTKEFMVSIEVIADTVLPVADAGANQTVVAPVIVTLDGSGSSDNWDIANYTWTFVYNGSMQTLWGSTPSFEFWTPGTYEIELNVTDMAGNTNTSRVTIEVAEIVPEFSSLIPVIIGITLIAMMCGFVGRRRLR